MSRLLKREFSSFSEIIWAFNQAVEWWWLSSGSTLQNIWYWSVLFLWIARSFAKNVVISVKERYIVVVKVNHNPFQSFLYSIKRHAWILIQCFGLTWTKSYGTTILQKESPRHDFFVLIFWRSLNFVLVFLYLRTLWRWC